MKRPVCFVLLLPVIVAATLRLGAHAQVPPVPPAPQLAVDIFKELVEINTTDSSGSTTKAAEAMAARFRAAGFPPADIVVAGPAPHKMNLVVRLRGTGTKKPILLLAHTDVVEARREDWSMDPFTFTERNGYYYGRGTTDMKDMAAAWVANLIRLKQEGFRPDRDLIVALTADEETGGPTNGVAWLLANRRDLIDAEYCLNEGGGGQMQRGRYLVYNLQAAEKVYASFALDTRNKGGHSSLPTKDNAIYELAEGLARLSRFEFPVRLNEVTRAFFARTASRETGQMAADMRAVSGTVPPRAAVARLSQSPYYNAMMRTTCVATQLEGGHAENALPQSARAIVNCRLLPDDSPSAVLAALERAVGTVRIQVKPIGEVTISPASPLNQELLHALETLVGQMWPGVPVVPMMATGATDGAYLRRAGIPTYGVGAWEDIDDTRAHGRDERIGVKQFNEEVDLLYRLVKALSS